MSVRTAMRVIYALAAIIVGLALALNILGIGLRGHSTPYDMPSYALLFAIMVTTAVIAIRFVRCPDCKKSLTRAELKAMRCSRCGGKFQA